MLLTKRQPGSGDRGPKRHRLAPAVTALAVAIGALAFGSHQEAEAVPVAAVAQAAVASGLHCGGNVIDYSSGFPSYDRMQRLTYMNCGDRTLRRKADINNARDGKCVTIGPYETRSLARGVMVKPWPLSIHIRGSKAC